MLVAIGQLPEAGYDGWNVLCEKNVCQHNMSEHMSPLSPHFSAVRFSFRRYSTRGSTKELIQTTPQILS